MVWNMFSRSGLTDVKSTLCWALTTLRGYKDHVDNDHKIT